ncbi:uncharacterized protein LOC132734133 [Ruditapes philippinarum]|uniref:uncharacterized protein LOC132734133 n=1 Tax=Ruditapes philippinarum TaxID=129788 RepID=UPI00295AE2CE|nr:uncharacterized protein LOC132734133 [Ruditapes philippinarum]
MLRIYGVKNQSDSNADGKETVISEIILNSHKSQTRSGDNRQKSYKETTNRCKEDVVQKTSIHKNKDKSSLHNVDGNELQPKSNKNERHIAVVRPHLHLLNCQEVENSDDILQHRTRESVQVTGVSENTQVVLHGAEGSESKRPKNQLCHGTEDQSLSLRDRDIFKGTPPEFQIDWTKVFLQLSRSFPATRWKFFALELLSNCQEMARTVDDTVNETELEAKNQHTEGWVFYAYFKVFNKWLNNLGCTYATFEHIEDAATHAFDSKEDKKRIDFIKRNPPMKSTTPMPLVPPYLDLTFRNNSALSQQYMALHDDEIPGNSTNYAREIYVRSRQTHRLQVGHCSYCSRYTTNEVSNLQETSVQLNKTSVDTKDNVKRERIKKRKKGQSKTTAT